MNKFKKIVFIVSFVAVCGLFFNFSVPTANAITADEIRAQIAELMAQISELQKQLIEANGGAQWCHDFNRNLKYGNAGAEVRALQIALDKQEFAPIPHKQGDKNYGNFEEYTASAVVGFQQKYKQDILVPWGLEYGTGYVGSTTREKLNELYGCGTIPDITCENLWWYDNNTQYCQQKQFCGMFMYLGLHTFATKQECETLLGQVVQPSITVLSPNGGEQWVMGDTNKIKLNRSIGSGEFNSFVHIKLNDQEGKEVGIIACKIGGWEKTIFEWDTKTVLNYCGAGVEGKTKEITPGTYKVVITKDEEGRPIIDASDDYFSIVAPQATTCHTSDLWAWNYCSPSCKCDVGEGDCDTDADCADGLYCAYNVGANYGQDAKMDVCERAVGNQ
jgi:hypothetical protein